jgi:hypothetical protein
MSCFQSSLLLFLSCALFRFPRACKKVARKEGREGENERRRRRKRRREM